MVPLGGVSHTIGRYPWCHVSAAAPVLGQGLGLHRVDTLLQMVDILLQMGDILLDGVDTLLQMIDT
jgi:hypothetical protein